MPSPSVTYTFANSTTADATQVNTNFTDILNALSDASKDLTINALTCAGAVDMQGNVTLGNGTPDDITWNGSLASTINIKTTFSYDFGSSIIGLKSLYLGSNDSAARTVRLIAGVIGSSYTYTLPTGAGSAGNGVVNLGSGSTAFLPQDAGDLINVGLAASVGSNALTVSLKGADGSDPSATNPVYITFRSSTVNTGTPVTRAVTSALSVVVSSGSTLGHASGVAQPIYVYALDNAGTVELAVSSRKFYDESALVTSTAEGGAGAADSAILYSTTARASVPCRLLGRLLSNQAVAGTYASSISAVSVAPIENIRPNSQVIVTDSNTHGSTNTAIRKFSTTVENTGSDITYATSAANGASFTINTDGLYYGHYIDYWSGGAGPFGVSLNSSALTTSIASITSADIVTVAYPNTGQPAHCSFLRYFRAGDVLRPHDNGNMDAGAPYCRFMIVRVG